MIPKKYSGNKEERLIYLQGYEDGYKEGVSNMAESEEKIINGKVKP